MQNAMMYKMWRGSSFPPLPALLAASLLTAGCRDALVPELHAPESPAFVETSAQPAVAGQGAIGDTIAIPKRNRQEFDFDVTDTPDGRLFVRDFSVVRADGSVGSFTADPDMDPATAISSFTQTSATCITFGGIGRVDTGDLFEFSVEACDNGNPGTDVDLFHIAIPAISYTKSDTLTEGEIVLSGATKGDLDVTAVTTGPDLDADGYTVTVDSTMNQAVGANATVRFNALVEGTYTVELSGVAGNCILSGENPRTVTIIAGSVVGTTFDVQCTATTTDTRVTGLGAIGDTIAIPTRNRQEFDFDVTDTPDGRLFVRDFNGLRADGSVGSFTADPDMDPATAISSFTQTSATCITFGGIGRVDTGDLFEFSVEACDNGNPGADVDFFHIVIRAISYTKSDTLTEGEIALSGATKGDLDVTAVTTGSDLDADGYTVTIDSTMSQAIGTNATVRFNALVEGTYTVELGGMAANCTLSGENPRTVTIIAGSVVGTTFGVQCTATTTDTRVTGLGAIGSPLALPHMDRLEFDFEATSDLTGRVVVTDYSVVRDDGTVGQMTVDAATDPETGITSFIRTSAECVTFGGIGRLDFGALYQFFIDACDVASDGVGADTFNMTLPDRPYSNGGTLTEGDIAISTF